MIDAKKGMAANQMKHHLDIGSYRSAWYLCHRVRAAMDELQSQLFGDIERGGKVKTWHIPRVNRHHVIAKPVRT
jgi:hypothetical protein